MAESKINGAQCSQTEFLALLNYMKRAGYKPENQTGEIPSADIYKILDKDGNKCVDGSDWVKGLPITGFDSVVNILAKHGICAKRGMDDPFTPPRQAMERATQATTQATTIDKPECTSIESRYRALYDDPVKFLQDIAKFYRVALSFGGRSLDDFLRPRVGNTCVSERKGLKFLRRKIQTELDSPETRSKLSAPDLLSLKRFGIENASLDKEIEKRFTGPEIAKMSTEDFHECCQIEVRSGITDPQLRHTLLQELKRRLQNSSKWNEVVKRSQQLFSNAIIFLNQEEGNFSSVGLVIVTAQGKEVVTRFEIEHLNGKGSDCYLEIDGKKYFIPNQIAEAIIASSNRNSVPYSPQSYNDGDFLNLVRLEDWWYLLP